MHFLLHVKHNAYYVLLITQWFVSANLKYPILCVMEIISPYATTWYSGFPKLVCQQPLPFLWYRRLCKPQLTRKWLPPLALTLT